jgi:hypothetical protein
MCGVASLRAAQRVPNLCGTVQATLEMYDGVVCPVCARSSSNQAIDRLAISASRTAVHVHAYTNAAAHRTHQLLVCRLLSLCAIPTPSGAHSSLFANEELDFANPPNPAQGIL